MMTQVETPNPEKTKPNKALRIAVLAVVGGVVGYVFGGWLARNDYLSGIVDTPTPSQLLAMVLGLMALAIMPVLILMSFSKKMYAAERDSEEPIEDSEYANAQVHLRWAAIAMLATGIELFALSWPVDTTTGPAILPLLIVFAMLGVQVWASWVLWSRYDELYRRVTLEGSAIAYGLIMLFITIWAALTQFGFAIAFTPLAVVVAISILGTVPPVWLSISRGLAK